MEEQQEKYGSVVDSALLQRILKLAKPFRKQFIIATLLAIVLAALSPVRPLLIQITVDEHILGFNIQGLVNMTILLIIVLMADSLLRYFFIYLTSWIGQSVIKNLRVRVFQHVLGLKPQYYDQTPIGRITTRTINDVETINDIFSQGIIQIIADLLTLIAIFGIMFYTNWKLTLVSLATFPIMIWGTYIFKEKIKLAFQKVRTQVSRLNTFTQEHISGMRIIQIFNAEEKEMNKFVKLNDDHKKAHIESIMYYSVFFPFVEVILASAIGLLVWYGSNLVLQYEVTLGVLIAFIMYLNMAFRPLRMLADKFNTLQMGIVAADRVFTVLDTEDRIDNSGTIDAKILKGDIAFEDVSFAYVADRYVLKNINFSMKAGETLAIVGHTGAGKSSIINILNRFYEIQKGSIKVDGVDIREYELSSLRSNIGLVLQDVYLFSGSVMDNITLHNENVTREDVIAAAKLVGVHDFIMRLPGGYDYNVMERGATLSLGQRQLISFIRALVFDPRVLVLDEATSSIDTESEQLIQHAIEKLIVNRTSIVIAHRLSTIQNAHHIMVLDQGEVMEIGTHEELLQKDGYYKKLHDMQFKPSKVA